MQTFLPLPGYAASAEVLDRARLGKQRVEVAQLLMARFGFKEAAGWRNHPAAKMWAGHEYHLALYGWRICQEWQRRGYDPGVTHAKMRFWVTRLKKTERPPWMGNEAFHESHRLKLVWKNPTHYGPLFNLPVLETEPEYIWPLGNEYLKSHSE